MVLFFVMSKVPIPMTKSDRKGSKGQKGSQSSSSADHAEAVNKEVIRSCQ